MCRALEEFYDDGVAEGVTKGKASAVIENINNLINNLGLSLEAACKAIGTSVEAYEAAKKLLENFEFFENQFKIFEFVLIQT